MANLNQHARTLFSMAEEMHKACLFTSSPADVELYEDGMRALQASAILDPVWDKPLIAQCVALTRKFKKASSEQISLAREALKRRESYDALTYLCRAAIHTLPIRESNSIIDDIQLSLKNEDLKNLCNFFIANCYYLNNDFNKFYEFMNVFVDNKDPNFNPYITVPIKTLRIDRRTKGDRKFSLFGRISRVLHEPNNKNISCIVSVSCNYKYLVEYGKFFFESFCATQPKGVNCFLSLSDSSVRGLAFLRSLDRWSDISERLSVVGWDLEASANIGPISASLRFFHVSQLLRDFNVPVVMLDFDTVILRSITDFIAERQTADVLIRLLPKVAPWEAVTGGIVAVRPTSSGHFFADEVGLYLEEILRLDDQQWWVDQNALESAWRSIIENNICAEVSDINKIRDKFLIQPTGKDGAKLVALEQAMMKIIPFRGTS